MNRIQYPARSAPALGFLRSRNNDVEIYVEDTACKIVWTNLINKLNTKGYRIKNINRMGGKKNVLEACVDDQLDKKRKRLYIVDGDLDRITGKKYKKLNHLYKIKSYCVENILIDPKEIFTLCQMICSDNELSNLNSILDYQSFDGNIKKLYTTFILFGIIQRKKISIKNVSMGVNSFLSQKNKKNIVDDMKVFKFNIITARRIIEEIGYKEFFSETKRMKKIKSRINYMDVVSGKDFLIPFLFYHLKDRFKYKQDMDFLKKYLSANCNFSREPSLFREFKKI